jgi:hypothetical protein
MFAYDKEAVQWEGYVTSPDKEGLLQLTDYQQCGSNHFPALPRRRSTFLGAA